MLSRHIQWPIFLIIACFKCISCTGETSLTADKLDELEKDGENNLTNFVPYYKNYQAVPEPGSCSESEIKDPVVAGWLYNTAMGSDPRKKEKTKPYKIDLYVLFYTPDLPKPPQNRNEEFDEYYVQIRKEANANHIEVFSNGFIQGKLDKLDNSEFPIYLLVHGWTDSINSLHMIHGVEWMYIVGDDWRYYGRGNVILMDWKDYAAQHYVNARLCTMAKAGDLLFKFIWRIFERFTGEKKENFFTSMKVAGHSLGAHLLGYLCEQIKNQLNNRLVGIFYALDPAGMLFNFRVPFLTYFRLDKRSVVRLYVLHTEFLSSSNLGLLHAIGHIDYYAYVQGKADWCDLVPADKIASCKHQRATNLFRASMVPPNNEDFKDVDNLLVGFNCLKTSAKRIGQQTASIFGIHNGMNNVGNEDEDGIYYMPIAECSPYNIIPNKRDLNMKVCKIKTSYQVTLQAIYPIFTDEVSKVIGKL